MNDWREFSRFWTECSVGLAVPSLRSKSTSAKLNRFEGARWHFARLMTKSRCLASSRSQIIEANKLHCTATCELGSTVKRTTNGSSHHFNIPASIDLFLSLVLLFLGDLDWCAICCKFTV